VILYSDDGTVVVELTVCVCLYKVASMCVSKFTVVFVVYVSGWINLSKSVIQQIVFTL